MLYKIKQIVSINEKIEVYNEIVELNVKKLNYFLLLFLFMWWETASKKSKLKRKIFLRTRLSLRYIPLGICIFHMFSKQCLTSLEIYFYF
jgi:hypothetical protein